MNEKQIRELLHHADAEALEKIAGSCPAADRRTEKRLWKRIMHRTTTLPEHAEDGVSVTWQVGTQKRSVIPILSGAVLCAMVLAVAGAAFFGKRQEIPTQPQFAAESTSHSDTEETVTAAAADRPEETEPETATMICIDLPAETETSVTDAQTMLPTTETEQTASPSDAADAVVSAATQSLPADKPVSEQTMTTEEFMTEPTMPVPTEKQPEPETTTTASDLTEEQLRQLEELRRESMTLFGVYMRQEKIILGEIPADTPRLTLEDFNAIIADQPSSAEIGNRIFETYSYPDFIGGSGILRMEYWFDDTGTEKITLFPEQGDIRFKGTDGYQLLYEGEPWFSYTLNIE